MLRLTSSVASVALALAATAARGQSVRPGGVIVKPPPPTQQADLLVSDLRFTSNARVQVTIRNWGLTPVSSPVTTALSLNDIGVGQVSQNGLAATTTATLQFDPATSSTTAVQLALAKCEAVTLRAEVHGTGIQEATTTNNVRIVSTRPACPDLVISEIKQDWEDYNTRYRVQVTIGNRGTGVLSATALVLAKAVENAATIPDPLDVDANVYGAPHFDIGPLQPGEKKTFHLSGKHLATATVAVLVRIDPDQKVPELDRSNNRATKLLGPH